VIGIDKDFDGKGEPVSTFRKPKVRTAGPLVSPQTSDEFTAESLGLQWQWQANFDKNWFSLSANPGWLRLKAVSLP
jgi:beta-xylosidase